MKNTPRLCTSAIVTFATFAMVGAAAAQVPPPDLGAPPAEPATPTPTPTAAESEPTLVSSGPAPTRLSFDVNAFLGIPQGDFDSIEADASLGIHGAVGYVITPAVQLHAFFRYVMVSQSLDEGIDVSYYDYGIGGRLKRTVKPQVELFGDLDLFNATVAADDSEETDSESGLGFAVRVGANYQLSRVVGLTAAASYSHADVNDLTAAWVGLEGGATFSF